MPRRLKKSVKAERFNLYLDYLRRGKLPKKAAREVNLDLGEIKERRFADPVFREAEKEAIAEFSEDVEQVLLDAAFGVVHYAKDAAGNDIYEEVWDKTTSSFKQERVRANRDTKAALDWLKARNSAVFNIDKAVQRHQLEVTVDVKSLFHDIDALRAQLEGRSAPPALESGDIVDAEVLEDGD